MFTASVTVKSTIFFQLRCFIFGGCSASVFGVVFCAVLGFCNMIMLQKVSEVEQIEIQIFNI